MTHSPSAACCSVLGCITTRVTPQLQPLLTSLYLHLESQNTGALHLPSRASGHWEGMQDCSSSSLIPSTPSLQASTGCSHIRNSLGQKQTLSPCSQLPRAPKDTFQVLSRILSFFICSVLCLQNWHWIGAQIFVERKTRGPQRSSTRVVCRPCSSASLLRSGEASPLLEGTPIAMSDLVSPGMGVVVWPQQVASHWTLPCPQFWPVTILRQRDNNPFLNPFTHTKVQVFSCS